MVCDIQDKPQVPIFGNDETLNAMETDLVASPSETQVQGNGELQDVTNTHRKISTKPPQENGNWPSNSTSLHHLSQLQREES